MAQVMEPLPSKLEAQDPEFKTLVPPLSKRERERE
jgi:hypothetical protein